MPYVINPASLLYMIICVYTVFYMCIRQYLYTVKKKQGKSKISQFFLLLICHRCRYKDGRTSLGYKIYQWKILVGNRSHFSSKDFRSFDCETVPNCRHEQDEVIPVIFMMIV